MTDKKEPSPKTVYSWHARLARFIDPDKNGRELAHHKKEFESMVLMRALDRENGRLNIHRLTLMIVIIVLIMTLIIVSKIAIEKTFK